MLALFVLLSVSLPARAFFDPPSITPENPRSGESVFVNVSGGVCDTVVFRTGFPKITREGNNIRILEYGNHYEPGDDLCVYRKWSVVEPIGSYPPGNYTLTVDLVYEDPFLGTPVTMNIGIVAFDVAAPPSRATPVPATSPWILAILVLAVLGLALRSFCNPRSFGLLLAMIAVSLSARAQQAQTIQVTLSNAPGAPTPAQVVAWANSSQRSAAPPLQAFKIVAPVGGDFLIPDRATGDFRSWLDQNPRSARAALERASLLTFLIPDVSTALAALQADPYVLDAAQAQLQRRRTRQGSSYRRWRASSQFEPWHSQSKP
jgi:hypothetical protein